MSGRSYSQFCALAQALDRIGDRWTLLVVRDLLAGPARFRDLARSLPGVATNLLTQRLRDLEEDGLVVQETLPPPAGVRVYRLTERGRGLEPVLEALAAWGMSWMAGADYRDPGSVRPLAFALRMTLRPRLRPGDALRVTLRIADEELAVEIEGGALTLRLGPASAAQAELRCGYRPVFAFVGGVDTFTGALARGDAELVGERAAIEALDRIRGRDRGAAT